MKILTVFALAVLLAFNSGCHALRKKFIRKKKPAKETPVYVDFKDYPERPSREAYIDYYIFVRGWCDELIKALEKGTSYKRQKRAIDEAIMNIEQILSFYNREGKEKLYPLYEDLCQIRQEIARSPNLSELKRNSVIKKVEQFRRRFEKDFNYTEAEKWMN
jgi:hypothetical protein